MYAPIIRDGQIERDVFQQFTGLRQFTNEDTLELLPILEVVSKGDLRNIDEYAQTNKPVLVDIPIYLTETENGLSEKIKKLLSGAETPIDILNEHVDEIPIPVVSGSLTTPFGYSESHDKYRELSSSFDRVSVRLFVGSTPLSSDQLDGLKKIKRGLSPDDIVLLDSIESRSLGSATTGRENIRRLAEIFEDYHRIILDAFSVFRGENYNFGPEIARETGASGFGDFAHDRRFPPVEGIPMGLHDTRNIYHYDFEDRQQRKFQGKSGYTGPDSAYERLDEWDKWDSDHCPFCQAAARTDSEGPSFWKWVRMGHYVESVIREEATVEQGSQ